jgi:hypothetical protein
MSLLKCKFEPGAMAHEVAIFVTGIEGEFESWADPRDIEVEDRATGAGFVPVRVIDEDTTRALVELPVEVIMGGRRIWVPLTSIRR